MPYLTPEDFGEGDDCRPLFIPATADWLAIVSGALTELVQKYNWEQFGALTVDECIERMQSMIDAYYDGCSSGDCVLPDDTPIFRIGADGHIEQLVDGEWVPPTGDYTIPPTEARTEPTEAERKCAAAANAANALSLLYEDLSDSIGEALDAVEAAAHLVAAVVGGIGLVIGAITGGTIQMAGFIFASVYAAVEFITADLWDEEFNAKLICILQSCAEDDGDVIHFDFDCVYRQLRGQTEVIDPTLTDLRLLAQISVLLSFIGSEGLDAAGATTAVEEPECVCDCLPELEIYPEGYGTLVEVSAGHWIATSALVEGAHRLSVFTLDHTTGCWRYFNSEFTVSPTYSQHSVCGDCAVTFATFPTDGTNICAVYLANETPEEFTWEFDARCEG